MKRPWTRSSPDSRSIAADTLIAAAFMTALYFAFDALAQLLVQ